MIAFHNFRGNATGMKRTPPGGPPSKFGRKQMMHGFEGPLDMRSSKHNAFNDGSITYKDSYASAIEPMDFDEWGNEDIWQEKVAYERDAIAIKKRMPAGTLKEGLLMKNNAKSSFLCNTGRYLSSSGSKLIEKPLHQSVLNVDNTKRLSFIQDPKQRKVSFRPVVNSDVCGKRLFPKWSPTPSSTEDQEISFPRMLTVTVEKLQKWPKVLSGTKVIFELYGILENICADRFSGSKKVILKSEGMKNQLNCTFYEIDRVFPPVEKGHWQRCIVLLRSNGDYQCLTIRSAKPHELKTLDKMVTSSGKAKALLLKTGRK